MSSAHSSPGSLDSSVARPPWWMATPAAASAEDQTNALCDVCRHVNFAWLMAHNLPGTDDQEEGKIRLGSLARVRDSTNCPFCRLVMATIFTNEPGALPDYDQVDCELHTIGNVKRDAAGHVDVWLVDSHGFSVTPSAWSCSIQLAQGDGPREQLYLGRIVRRDWTDLSLVKRWLPLCEQHHAHWPVREEELSGVGQDALPSTFRLVDVQRKCLVPAPPAARYVALSYLWGKAPVFKLLLENRSVLEHHGSFVDPAVDLPGTIKDAIFLVDAMGENYLWIDSLCIIQNDDSDKMSQIPCMGAIYTVLTVVAAAGDNAGAGLPGIRSVKRTSFQHVENVQGLSLINAMPGAWTVMGESVWSTRGWTYQERKLSKRMLMFTQHQAYWNCEHASFQEDKCLESRVTGITASSSSQHRTNFETYAREVSQYTARNISYATDGLNAFAAISQVLAPRFRGPLWCGIPTTAWDAGLLWYPRGWLKRRLDPHTGEKLFPSWSWAAWDGPVVYDDDNLCVTTDPRAQWKNTELAPAERAFPDHDSANAHIRSKSLGAREWQLHTESVDHYYTCVYFTEVGNSNTWFSSPILPPPATEAQHDKDLHLAEHPPSVLRFRAWSVKFSVNGHHNKSSAFYGGSCGDKDEDHQVCRLLVFDTHGRVAGTIHVSGDHKSLTGTYEFVALSRSTLTNDDDDLSFRSGTFQRPPQDDLADIYLGDSSKPPQSSQIDKGSNSYLRNWFDDRRFNSKKPWCQYNVLLVQPTRLPVSSAVERLGIGKIHLDAFHQAGATLKDIVLV